ncbi:hypothetical protein AtNW77_Chr1g0030911 [Arabidopsis thaliana]|uniref:At1g28135 n=4 Tax=Arabidopsis TaxID=3701 RepID=Q6IDD0_ARATH|nr:uncharacterized protein AT1G28135 [Arabidopsis thaliana]KAG7647789.1 hypothetical protein ISN45_At01g028000 [Arabidopsis thaliana x Arabidopsis arenosa]KAG7655715.1 hypothetical protein ISN44_As01g027660 [Arabidopsis suecica]AAR24146.1 At1g28135 [Arabidopsis thaliana]AAT35233.1 At1g28135 [Arabidopsis thaliana]AEE30923.1 hypothetical protein AT1G28135 [Arabidopsis thaliana]|eukprot:NP_174135.1 hypothetical protein AT1G28135 [Arabidopsis thaliana]
MELITLLLAVLPLTPTVDRNRNVSRQSKPRAQARKPGKRERAHSSKVRSSE